ncbi:MAG: FAD-dependent oxidoreductase [Burkholderiales bacterium]|nr:FAD-dependent oxidoreductase [Burkholderiales bacterium]
MPVLSASEARFEYTVDVVVIGAGACGLTAALAAKEAGAEVLVLERDTKPTGSTSLSTGLIPAAGTKLQKSLGIDDSPELLAGDILAKAKQQTDAAIVRMVAEASGPTVDWLAEVHGVAFKLVEGFLYPGHSVLRMHGTPNRTGTELQGALLAAADRRQIDLVTGARATDLYATADGRVTAVRYARPDGTLETVGLKALALACCGFGGNKEMVRELIPEIADAEYWGHAGNQGDAIAWGRELGAAMADLGSYQGHGAVATPYGNPMNWGLLMPGGFQVNALGQRFSNEVRGYSEQAVDTIAQPGRFAWNIYDEVREKPILGFTDYDQVAALGGIRKAPTIRALAQMIGVPADALEATVAEVGELCAGRGEDRFGRDFRGKEPLRAPFCAVKVTGALFHTQGGLVIDTATRVLRPDGSAFPNLFAGGGAARGMSGPSRWGYFSGGGLLSAVTQGRSAGTRAAQIARGSN